MVSESGVFLPGEDHRAGAQHGIYEKRKASQCDVVGGVAHEPDLHGVLLPSCLHMFSRRKRRAGTETPPCVLPLTGRQHLSHFATQFVTAEGFLDKGHSLGEHPPARYHIRRVARHVEHFDSGLDRLHPLL